MIRTFSIIFLKDFRETFYKSSRSWFTVAFFMLCLLVFPLSMGNSSSVLAKFSIAAIWISALFATLLSLENMFKEDYDSGVLEQYFINGIPLSAVVYSKCLNHWIFTGLPIILLSPFCLFLLQGDIGNILNLLLSLLLGTFLFTLIGSPLAALGLGTQLKGPLLVFLAIPFYLPVIIFGVLSNIGGNNSNSEFYLLLFLLSLGMFFLPLITMKILSFILE